MVAANQSAVSRHRENHCDRGTLVGLLDETLPEDIQRVAVDHLTHCDDCRDRLEGIAGDEVMWVETRSVYSEEAAAGSRDGQAETIDWTAQTLPRTGRDHEAAGQWIRAISESIEGQDALGRIDRYRIDAVIGTGGMGVVAAAWDEPLARPVALKFLAPHLAGLSVARRRFAREARAVAAIIHPSIMPIYGVNETSHPPYLVMPLIGSATEGRSLQDRIDQEGPLSLEDAIGVAAQIAEGLAAAHTRGVIHRDIKPGNILCESNSPRVMISDFGLARAIDDATVTVSGMVAGTPQYMSPEQASGETVGPQSDLFSLGAVIYAMLTGRPPFVAESPIAVLRQVIDTPEKPVSERVETLPPWVDSLLQRFLGKAPAERLSDASTAAALLRRVEAHLRNPSANALPEELIDCPSALHRTVRWGAIAAAALVVAVLLGPIVAKFFTSGSGDAPQSLTVGSVAAEFPLGMKSNPSPAGTIGSRGPTVEEPGNDQTSGVLPGNILPGSSFSGSSLSGSSLSGSIAGGSVGSPANGTSHREGRIAPDEFGNDSLNGSPDDSPDLSWEWSQFEWETSGIRSRIDAIQIPVP